MAPRAASRLTFCMRENCATSRSTTPLSRRESSIAPASICPAWLMACTGSAGRAAYSRAQGEKIAAANPDAKTAVDAIAGFVETSGQTLTIKLTPLGKVPMLQLLGALNSEPIVALAQFRIEASTGL